MHATNCGKVEEPSSSRNRSPSTARFAATSAFLTVTLSRSDRAPLSSTVNAWRGGDADSASRRRASANLCLEQSLTLTSKGVPDGWRKWTERDRAECERLYRARQGNGRRAAKALRRSVRL